MRAVRPEQWVFSAVAVGGFLLAVPSPGFAQAPPSQGLVIRDGSLGEGPAGVVPPGIDPLGQPANYLISPELGEQRGGNLFHSFERFSIGTGETATFTGPDPVNRPQTVDNIISRVTGGAASDIDGRLRSTVLGADVYLLNPAGLMFGPEGELDVQGSFHASTADSLRFDNGEVFETHAGGAVPLLQVAAPQEFGFLSTNVAPIVVEGSLVAASGASIEVAGNGDLTIGGSVDASSRAGNAGSVTIHGGKNVTISGSVDASSLSALSGEPFFGKAGNIIVETDGDSVLIAGTLRAQGRDGVISLPEDKVRTLGSVIRDDPLGEDSQVVPWKIENGEFVHYWIAPELGWIPPSAETGSGAGPDLFHSFHRFDLAPREIAVFANPETLALERVFSRVTGGTASHLDGTLRSEFPGAHVHLLNPNGLELGPEGRIEVRSRSFHAGTADTLSFADGQVFETHSGGTIPQRAVALPFELGFSPTNSARIAVDGVLRAPEGGSIELRGARDVAISGLVETFSSDAGNITVRADEDVTISGSVRTLADHGDAGSVTIHGGEDVTISGSIDASTDEGNVGSITVHGGGDVAIDGSIRAFSSNGIAGSVTVHGGRDVAISGDVDASSQFGIGGTVTLDIHGDSVLIAGNLRAQGRNSPGMITLPEDKVRTLGSVVRDDPLGGDLEVVPWKIENGEFIHYWIAPEGGIAPIAEGGTEAGPDLFHSFHRFDLAPREIAVFANPGGLALEHLFSRVTGGAASRLDGTLRSEVPGADVHLLNPAGLELGSQGRVEIRSRSFHASTADSVRFGDGQVLETRAGGIVPQRRVAVPFELGFSPTNSTPIVVDGNLLAEGASVELRSAGDVAVSGVIGAFGGRAVDITVHGGGDVAISGSVGVFTDSPFATAGSVAVGAGRDVTISGFVSSGESVTVGAGEHVAISGFVAASGFAPGSVTIHARQDVAISGDVRASSGLGNAGSIAIEARNLRMLDGSTIESSAFDAGSAGTIVLQASKDAILTGSQVAAVSTGGPGGSVLIRADRLTLERGTTVLSESLEQGGGSLRIEATNGVRVASSPGARTSVFAFSPGGANLEIIAPDVTIDRAVVGRPVPVTVGLPVPDPDDPTRFIFVPTTLSVPPGSGSISIEADRLILANGGSIEGSTSSGVPGGAISVDAKELLAVTGADALGNRSRIQSTTLAEAVGGEIRILSPEVDLDQGGQILATSEGLGQAGSIVLTVDRLSLEGGAEISSEHQGRGNAGLISIDANSVLLRESSITTAAREGGGGDVEVRLGDTMHLAGSNLTASVTSGSGGNLSIGPNLPATGPVFVILKDSQIIARAAETGGFGGRITVTADAFLADTNSLVDASAPGGPEFAGTVEIDAPDADVTGDITALPASLLDAAALLAERCGSRQGGEAPGSFVVAGRDGAPAGPEGLLPASVAVRGIASDPGAEVRLAPLLARGTYEQRDIAWQCE